MTVIVDLDKTFFKVDTLPEMLVALFKKNPFYFFSAFFYLLKGKSFFKSYIISKIDFNIETIPVNQQVLEYIQKKKYQGKSVVLITGAHDVIAKKVKSHFNVFSDAFGTTEDTNLIGKNKLKFIKENFDDFEYIGDSQHDIPIWKEASLATIVCNQGSKTLKALNTVKKDINILETKKNNSLHTFFKAIRIHQWAKNTLIFVPIILDHKYLDFNVMTQGFLAILSFSLTASSVYLINDLFDLDADRIHKKKKFRPIPAGNFTPQNILMTLAVFLFLILNLVKELPFQFTITLSIYFFITCLYSFRLKKVVFLDVVILALLFTIRLIAGHSATGIIISPWLLSFSIFIFLSLACIKRFSELIDKLPAKEEVAGRGYIVSDKHIISQIGSTAGIISTFIITLYMNSEKIVKTYHTPYFLWGLCPLLLLWIGRLWIKTHRNEINVDPVLFVIKDKFSLFIGFVCLSLVLLARI